MINWRELMNVSVMIGNSIRMNVGSYEAMAIIAHDLWKWLHLGDCPVAIA